MINWNLLLQQFQLIICDIYLFFFSLVITCLGLFPQTDHGL